MPISPIITTAGLTAVLNATNDGLSARITHVALGDAAWTPDNSATALQNERRRVTVSNGERIQPTQIHITAVENGSTEYWIRELGFYLDDGTLLAIWSDPEQPLAFKAAGVDILLAFDLVLSALPDDSVEVVGTGGVNLPPATSTVVGVLRFATDSEATGAERRDVSMSPVTSRLLGDSRYSRTGHRHAWSTLTGRPSSFPPSSHDHDWEDIQNRPTVFPPRAHGHTWSQVSNKPTTFPPRSHEHPWSEVSDKPSAYPPTSHRHSWSDLFSVPSRFPPSEHDHGDEYLRRGDFTASSGLIGTENHFSQHGWGGYFDFSRNYANISPPDGFTVENLVAFMPSIGRILYEGDISEPDIVWCHWFADPRNNWIRVICANSQTRRDPFGHGSYVNYLAIWQR